LASLGVTGALDAYPELEPGVNLVGDSICHPAVADSLGADHVPAADALGE
jgi:hypothetical protein